MDLWGMANALGAAVKQQTQEIAASLQGTDWKSELVGLQKGLKEDTEEFSQRAKVVTEELSTRTLDMAKQLPSALDEGRRKAVATLEQLPNSTMGVQDKAKVATQRAGESLSSLGQRIMLSTTELFDQFSSTIQTELSAAHGGAKLPTGHKPPASISKDAAKFSRFEADVAAMQRDSSTYCDEPEDGGDFSRWLETFHLEAAKPEIARLLSENMFMSELQSRIVPVVVNYDTFWTRYYYRLHKLEDKHAKVAALKERTAQRLESKELAWESDDDEEGAPSVPDAAGVATGAAAAVAAAATAGKVGDSAAAPEAGHQKEIAAKSAAAEARSEPSDEANGSDQEGAINVEAEGDVTAEPPEGLVAGGAAHAGGQSLVEATEEESPDVAPEAPVEASVDDMQDAEQHDDEVKALEDEFASMSDVGQPGSGAGAAGETEVDLDEDWGDDVGDWE